MFAKSLYLSFVLSLPFTCQGALQSTFVASDLRDPMEISLAPNGDVYVIEREGRWFLSPTRTVLDSLAEGLESRGEEGTGDWTAALLGLLLRATDGDLAIRHG